MRFQKKALILFSLLFLLMTSNLYSTGLKIYTEDSPPDQFLDKNGKLTGFAVEVVAEIQKRCGTNYPVELVPWARGYSLVQTEPNVVLFSMTRTAERNPLFQWVGPLSESAFGFYAKSDSKLTIGSLNDAKSVKSIGVYTNDVRDLFLTKQGFKNIERVSDNTLNYKKLMAGRIELLAGSINSVNAEAKDAGIDPKELKLLYIFLRAQLYIAVSKGTPKESVDLWNNHLEAMKKDGTFKTIFKKYYPDNELPGPGINEF